MKMLARVHRVVKIDFVKIPQTITNLEEKKKKIRGVHIFVFKFPIFRIKKQNVSEGPYKVRKIDFVKIREKERIWIKKHGACIYLLLNFRIFSTKNESVSDGPYVGAVKLTL